MKRSFDTYHTETAAREDMKRRRKKSFTITYAAAWGCWVAWYNG